MTKKAEEANANRIVKLVKEYSTLLSSIGQDIRRPPPGQTFVEQVEDVMGVDPPLDELGKLEFEKALEAYFNITTRKNVPFFCRLVDRSNGAEHFYPLYQDENFPMKDLMSHLQYDMEFANPLLLEMEEEMLMDESRFAGRLLSMDLKKKHPERNYIASYRDWDFFSAGMGKKARRQAIYEFVSQHTVECATMIHLLNAAWDKPCAIMLNGLGDTKTVCCCNDVTLNYRCEQAQRTASEELDAQAWDMWMGLFDRVENGRVLLYYFLRFARQQRIPGVILAGITGGGKSIIAMLFDAIKVNGSNITLFSSQYEDAGSTSLILCEEYSPKKHQNLDVNILKAIITGKKFSARQIYSAETSVVGHRYLLMTDNWDNTPLFRLLGQRSGDEDALKNRLSLFSFNEKTQAYLRNYPNIDEIIQWTTGQKRLDPRNYPYACRFAKKLSDMEDEIFKDVKGMLSKDGIAARTGVAAISSTERGIHQSHSPIFIKSVKMYIDYLLLVPNQGNSDITSFSKHSLIGMRGGHQGFHFFEPSRRFRSTFDESLRAAGLKTYNTEHGDSFENILKDGLPKGMVHTTCAEEIIVSDGKQGFVRLTPRRIWTMRLEPFLEWLAASTMVETYKDIAHDICRNHGLNVDSNVPDMLHKAMVL